MTGCVKSECTGTSRHQWVVCFPGQTTQNRLTIFQAYEEDLADKVLELFRAVVSKAVWDRADFMQIAGHQARRTLREHPSTTLVQLEEAALAALKPVPPTALPECAVPVKVHIPSIVPICVDSICATVVSSFVPSTSIEVLEASPSACAGGPVEGGASTENNTAAIRASMRGYAMNIRKTGKLVGIFAFLLFAVFRQRRVQLLFGSGLHDVLSNYAPWAVDLMIP